MTRSALIVGLMASLAMAQTNHVIPGFRYVGCVEADSGSFGINIRLFNGASPEMCQDFCSSSSTYAALGGDDGGCHCDVSDPKGGNSVKYRVIDETACSRTCLNGDGSAGNCGSDGTNAEDGLSVYNLYQKVGRPRQDLRLKKRELVERHHEQAQDEEQEDQAEEQEDQAEDEDVCEDIEAEEEPAEEDVQYISIEATPTPEPSVVVVTVHSCPVEVEDCPYRPATTLQLSACPPGGCKTVNPPAAVAETPTEAPAVVNVVSPTAAATAGSTPPAAVQAAAGVRAFTRGDCSLAAVLVAALAFALA